MIVAVIETNDGGHNRWYFECHLCSLLRLGHEVIAIAPFAREVVSGLEMALQDRVTAFDFGQFSKFERIILRVLSKKNSFSAASYFRQRRLEKLLSTAEKESGPIDFVFYGCLWIAELSGSISLIERAGRAWGGLCLHLPQFRAPAEISFRTSGDLAKVFSSPHCVGICLLDEFAVPWLKERVSSKVLAHPEIVHVAKSERTNSFARLLRERAKGRPIVSISGHLVKTKGVEEFIRLAFERRFEKLFFVVVGAPGQLAQATIAKLEASAQGEVENVYARLERIADEDEFNGVFAASDLIWAAYRHFPNSSGIQGKAAMFGAPCVVSDGYLMAERNRRYSLGPIVEEGNINELRQILTDLSVLEKREKWKSDIKRGLYFSEHGVNGLDGMFNEIVEAL
ncbi:hypothetical protein [Roseibacillus persicicus]|uniref:hypothetical protein n=1 Tax=Roseibacillus persicicus TaxID=454148 RepID=UPI00280F75A1|nr:hypothetical protein [Roseibacillus persicicus]MDQ8188858.1 hypothetical protein [Roseibacillus persicicus]